MHLLLFRSLRFLPFSLLIFALNSEAAFSDISKIYREMPSLEAFNVCLGGGCAEVKQMSITPQEWIQVTNVFTKQRNEDVSEASFEREKISEAVGELEKIVGAKIGTSEDRAGTFNNSKYAGQQDCNDEAINTTTYIRLLQYNGLVKLHVTEDTRTRNFFFNGWPHSTAVIHEIATGERFAVDSWFYDNGVPATIVPFKLWKSGYIPADSPIR